MAECSMRPLRYGVGRAQNLGRQWIGIDISLTACRVVAKRLRAVCKIREDENLSRAGRGHSQDAPTEIDVFFRKSGKVITALTVQEILEEQIAKKLA